MNYRYQNIDVIKYQATGSEYYVNNVYPEIPPTNEDNYVITVLGDRLDLLAFDFYGDSTFWWVIASANSLAGDSLVVEPGTQLRIPVDLASAINNYKIVNATR
jgi:nucleoid-associated protein YgaU